MSQVDLPDWLKNIRAESPINVQVETQSSKVFKPLNCGSDMLMVFDTSVDSGTPFCGELHVQVQVVNLNCRANCIKRNV